MSAATLTKRSTTALGALAGIIAAIVALGVAELIAGIRQQWRSPALAGDRCQRPGDRQRAVGPEGLRDRAHRVARPLLAGSPSADTATPSDPTDADAQSLTDAPRATRRELLVRSGGVLAAFAFVGTGAGAIGCADIQTANAIAMLFVSV